MRKFMTVAILLMTLTPAQKDSDAAEAWWKVPGKTCVGAYQAVGAKSSDASYINLANPGANDLKLAGAAIMGSSEKGWRFTGRTYLDTGIAPASGYSVIVRVANCRGGMPIGEKGGNRDIYFQLGATGIWWRYGNKTVRRAPGFAEGVLALAGPRAYRDGRLDIDTGGTWSAGKGRSLYVGARNLRGIGADLFNGDILAVAVYSETLTAEEVAALTARMKALAGDPARQVSYTVAPSDAAAYSILPYIQNTTSDAASILWVTPEPSASVVQYCRFSDSPKYEHKVSESRPVALHRVRIAGLRPDTRYAYRVKCGERTHTGNFTTAPGKSRPIRFAIVGDSRYYGTTWEKGPFHEHMMAQKPEFLLHGGDLVDDGLSYFCWPPHFQRFAGSMSLLPMFAVRGNHEGDGRQNPDNDWFGKYFELPGGEPYSSFDWGNSHFALVSYTHRDRAAGFLAKDFAKTDKTWKFYMTHYPIYCTGYHSPDDSFRTEGRPAVETVMDEYNVDVVITSHAHMYERSFPLRGGKRDDWQGTVYLVNGGAVSNPLPAWWTAAAAESALKSTSLRLESHPMYMMVEADDDTLDVRAYGLEAGGHSKGKDARIVEYDHYIRWRDESLPRQKLAGLRKEAGEVLLESIENLGAMIYGPAANELVSYLENGDERIRRAAALALERIASESAAPRLIEHLSNPDVVVRRRLARALEAAMPAEISRLIEPHILDADEDGAVRISLIGALEFHIPRRRIAVAFKVLESKASNTVRRRAADLIKRAASKEQMPTMMQLFQKESDGYVTGCLACGLDRMTGVSTDLAEVVRSKPGRRQKFVRTWLGAKTIDR